MNINQKERDSIRAGNIKLLEEILLKEAEKHKEMLIYNELGNDRDNTLKGYVRCLMDLIRNLQSK